MWKSSEEGRPAGNRPASRRGPGRRGGCSDIGAASQRVFHRHGRRRPASHRSNQCFLSGIPRPGSWGSQTTREIHREDGKKHSGLQPFLQGCILVDNKQRLPQDSPSKKGNYSFLRVHYWTSLSKSHSGFPPLLSLSSGPAGRQAHCFSDSRYFPPPFLFAYPPIPL